LQIGFAPIALLNGVRGEIARSSRAVEPGRTHPWWKAPSVAGSVRPYRLRSGHKEGHDGLHARQGDTDVSRLFTGIDVSKEHRDLHLSCERRSHRFTNDLVGFAAIDAHLRARADTPYLVALEPTGGYEDRLLVALAEAGRPAPPPGQSGRSKRKGRCQAGRARVRRLLCLAALGAIKARLAPLCPFCKRLRKAGKVAMRAVMRKFVMLNAMLKTQTGWSPKMPA
jgi:hypothetical protein